MEQNSDKLWSTGGAFLIAQLIKTPPAMQETPVLFLGQENPLENTHSSVLGLPLWFSQFTGEINGKPFQYCLENPMNSMKRQNDMTLSNELPRQVDTQYATGEEWRNTSEKNEEAEPKQKQQPAVDMLVMEVKSDAVKYNIAQEPVMLGP